ncbi:hypothetical protein C3369_02620 [Escherichia sp. ESNIH1]|uniref:RHS repeat-associated core domain-containing protein n=1 Tax=Escherichia sp. ESNIH1 TaxID=1985876 RepID=UPI000CDD37D0|nr:RHS repeat-associated core domain-containing protein [Escherichia sp. ESNIH1]POU04263.1 hypothetical protein C3369_02620 [Escherichia sp. ESNIH1]
MSLQLIGTNKTNSTLLTYDGSNQQINLFSAFGSVNNLQNGQLPGFNGERPDPFTGVSHLGNGYRAYSPILMRFTCPDNASPFGVGGINSYAYCENDPVNFTDPSGHGIFTLAVRALAFALRVLLTEETAETVAVGIAKTTKLVLTVGTQLSSTITGIAAYAESSRNPAIAARLAQASHALGLINSATTLYNAPADIYRSVRKYKKFRSSQRHKIENIILESITGTDELGTNSQTQEVVEAINQPIAASYETDRAINNTLDSLSHRPEPNFKTTFGEEFTEGQLVSQIVSSSTALTSTVLQIASNEIKNKNPTVSAYLHLASGIFGLYNTIGEIPKTVTMYKNLGKRIDNYKWKEKHGQLIEGPVSDYPGYVALSDFTFNFSVV